MSRSFKKLFINLKAWTLYEAHGFRDHLFCLLTFMNWCSGNTLTSHLWGWWFKPRTLCGKDGSFLPMVGSLQNLDPTVCTGFHFLQNYSSWYNLHRVESDVKTQINISTTHVSDCSATNTCRPKKFSALNSEFTKIIARLESPQLIFLPL